MAQRKINARSILLEVESATPDTWHPVENLSSVVVNLSENEETVDTTDYDSEGVYEGEVMQRGATLELEGMVKKDTTTGALPPGRARIEEMAGETKVGYDSLGRVRFRHPMDTQWKVWDCTFSLSEQGGGVNDKASWGATVTKSGPTTLVSVA